LQLTVSTYLLDGIIEMRSLRVSLKTTHIDGRIDIISNFQHLKKYVRNLEKEKKI
jgi:hypothetical protein